MAGTPHSSHDVWLEHDQVSPLAVYGLNTRSHLMVVYDGWNSGSDGAWLEYHASQW